MPFRQLPTLPGAWTDNWDVHGIAGTVQFRGWVHFPAVPEQPDSVGCLHIAPSRQQKHLCGSEFTAGGKFLEAMINQGIWTQIKLNRMSYLLVRA